MKLDILAFGVHPDDVELSCSGVLLNEKKAGKKTGIIDLTEGELGTRGTVETRYREAAAAARILQTDIRQNLRLPDGFFENNRETQMPVIQAIRAYQPEIVLCNAPSDRHPDHGRSAQLVSDAAFLSGLLKVETEWNGQVQAPWRPKYVFNYIQDRYLHPDFVVDITDVFEAKLESIKAYETQFYQAGAGGPQTYISTPDFLDSVIYRHKMFGKMIGVKYAEGFISVKTIGLKNFDAIVQATT
jgi:bacillithiol biosynthesis deacetylase BshB1